jgi:HD-GYP domain-containing protein (c-di-GMP phosphodiesterase class II)
MKIRLKLLLVILPPLAAATVLTGVFSSAAAQTGMTRVAVRLQSFKAEQLSSHMRSQWDLLVENGFAGNAAFVQAAQTNVESFALGLLRSDTELILAVDSAGDVGLQTSPFELEDSEKTALFAASGARTDGWVELQLDGKKFVGQTFYFVPFRWQTFVLEEESSFAGEVRQITRRSLIILVAALITATALVLLFSAYLTQPLSRVSSAIESIEPGSPSNQPIPVEYPDEIGDLAHRFNLMNEDLVTAYGKLKDFAFREALARRQIVKSERETLVVLARAAEYRDPETGDHINRVGLYARLMARELGLDDYRQNLIYFASPLHDIGKLGVPDSILLKPGKLTAEEFEIIKKHPLIAYDVLKDSESPYLKAGAVIALTHHEHYDGNGYPQGLAGDEIPLFGRIAGLVDVFDALMTKRPYKEAWDLETTLAYLESQKDLHFESRLVEIFLARRDEVLRIFEENS